MNIRYISAVLFVKDMAISRQFYEGIFGQKVDTDFGKNVGYTSGLALWEAGVAHQIIYDREYADSAPLGRQNFELYFESDDIEDAWQELQAAGVTVIQSLYEQPWGQRTPLSPLLLRTWRTSTGIKGSLREPSRSICEPSLSGRRFWDRRPRTWLTP